RALLATQADITILGEGESGDDALRLIEQYVPDVLLLDLIMPGQNSIEAIRQIKQISPRTQVIILTSYYTDEQIFPALHAGALSYILKDLSPDALIQTVRQAAAGEAVLHPRVAARVVQEIRDHKLNIPEAFVDLTEREIEVLRLVAEGKSNAEIAEI